MRPRTRELLAHLDGHHAELRRAVDTVPVALRARPPAADRWSVANVLEHLAIVERRVVQGLARGLAEARSGGLPPDTDASVVRPADIARYLDRERRLVAGAASQPTGHVAAEEAWAAIEEVRGSTRALVVETDEIAVDAVVLPHPVFGPLDFYQWIVFLGGHEGRHALQVREIGRAVARHGDRRGP
jgi:hypothetical protein